MGDFTTSLRLEKFKTGKHKMLLPNEDCVAMAFVHNNKMYGGFVRLDFNNEIGIDNQFNFLIKCGKNKIRKLKNAQ